MHDKLQALMDQAYARWQGQSWDKQQFWDQLDAKERIAVFFGNMNYQVENGGHSQWMGNGYATQEVVEFLIRHLRTLGTSEANVQMQHLAEIRDLCNEEGWDSDRWDDEIWEAVDLDSFDRTFYKINDKLLLQVEEKLLT